jgi:hypothetical protein
VREKNVAETPTAELRADGPSTVPCKGCGSTEPPDEQGLCRGVPGNKCRWARPGNKLASKHDGRAKLTPEDLATRDALMERLFRERGGRSSLDIVSQLRVEDYATAQIQLGKVTRRLELLGAVSEGGKKRSSLVDTYNTFSARVERLAQELPPVAAGTTSRVTGVDYDALTIDQLIERSTSTLQTLLDLRDDQREGEAAVAAATEAAGLSVQAPTDPAGEVPVSTPMPAPEIICPYCRRKCVGPDHVAYETLHWDDPTEVKKRDKNATAVMLRQIGKPNPWL